MAAAVGRKEDGRPRSVRVSGEVAALGRAATALPDTTEVSNHRHRGSERYWEGTEADVGSVPALSTGKIVGNLGGVQQSVELGGFGILVQKG